MKQFWEAFEKRALHETRRGEYTASGASAFLPLGTTLHAGLHKGKDRFAEWAARVGLGTAGAVGAGLLAHKLTGGHPASALAGRAGNAAGNILGTHLVQGHKYDEHGMLKPEYKAENK